jgi:predicted flap endonuclease-1-like 5' DNA nuclease
VDALGVTVRRRMERPAARAAEPGAGEADSDVEFDSADEVESWMELAGEGEPVAASVVVLRRVIGSQEELDALEDDALAEAIAAMEGSEDSEGTVDAAVYTQVLDDASGQAVAVVMAVAAEPGGGIEAVGDEPNEVAVMVTDAIESEDDIAILEEEAVEGAIDTLLAEDEDADEVEVTIYSGVTGEGSGQSHAAVVAIAVKVLAPATDASRGMIDSGDARREPRPKDLELIEGIGPKIAALLIEHGIYDLADLADASIKQLRDILAGAGRRFRLADPTTWPEQAALGAAGAWDRLSALQTRLKAGRAR